MQRAGRANLALVLAVLGTLALGGRLGCEGSAPPDGPAPGPLEITAHFRPAFVNARSWFAHIGTDGFIWLSSTGNRSTTTYSWRLSPQQVVSLRRVIRAQGFLALRGKYGEREKGNENIAQETRTLEVSLDGHKRKVEVTADGQNPGVARFDAVWSEMVRTTYSEDSNPLAPKLPQ